MGMSVGGRFVELDIEDVLLALRQAEWLFFRGWNS
jgi:hypothetical protein